MTDVIYNTCVKLVVHLINYDHYAVFKTQKVCLMPTNPNPTGMGFEEEQARGDAPNPNELLDELYRDVDYLQRRFDEELTRLKNKLRSAIQDSQDRGN